MTHDLTNHSSDESDTKPTRIHRRRALKGGILSYQNQSLTVECVVRDLSEHGAKVIIENDTIVPNNFDLSIPVDGTRVECNVQWRDGNTLGVLFVSSVSDDQRIARVQSMNPEFVTPRSVSILKRRD